MSDTGPWDVLNTWVSTPGHAIDAAAEMFGDLTEIPKAAFSTAGAAVEDVTEASADVGGKLVDAGAATVPYTVGMAGLGAGLGSALSAVGVGGVVFFAADYFFAGGKGTAAVLRRVGLR